MLGTNSDTFTFVSEAHGCKRLMDHCVVTESAFDSLKSVEVMYDVTWSDHFPMFIVCELNVIISINSVGNSVTVWGNSHLEQSKKCGELCNKDLKHIIDFPDECRDCCDYFCSDREHHMVIDYILNY